MKITREKLNKDFGKRCKKWAPLCIVCEVHRALDVLEMGYELGIWRGGKIKRISSTHYA